MRSDSENEQVHIWSCGIQLKKMEKNKVDATAVKTAGASTD